jgi:RHS repeat-associated protein
VDYEYDVFDRRIAKTVDPDGEGAAKAETERFVYDGEHIALVFDGKGQQTHRYLYGPQIDQILADEVSTGVVHWALTDYQGSVRDIINNQGQLLNHIRYDSFGNITQQTNANLDFRFSYTGREFDEEIGLYYYRSRYYDASTGRFISEDPMGFGAGDSNLYRYVGNSPTNFTDPSGNFAIPWYVATAATLVGSMTIAGALFPNPAQTPTETCDMDPRDNSVPRTITEIVTSLGLGIATTLFRRAMNSLLDDLLKPSGGIVDDISPSISPSSFNGLVNEDILVREVATSKGALEVAAEISIDGKTLKLLNLSIFPKNVQRLKIPESEILKLKDQLIQEARDAGFEKLQITGRRVSGASFDGTLGSGKKIDITIDLTK